MSGEVAAVVPTLGAASLTAALASVRRQGATVEITVVHQGPAPVPPESLVFADQVLTFPAPLGFAAATNAGIATVRAPWLLLLGGVLGLGAALFHFFRTVASLSK